MRFYHEIVYRYEFRDHLVGLDVVRHMLSKPINGKSIDYAIMGDMALSLLCPRVNVRESIDIAVDQADIGEIVHRFKGKEADCLLPDDSERQCCGENSKKGMLSRGGWLAILAASATGL